MSIEAKLLHLQAIQNLLAPYRYLYCVDLEATCDEVGESESPRPLAVLPDQMETIEIGLVVIDLESLEIVDEFQRFVRPQINPTLTDSAKSSPPFNRWTWTVPEYMKKSAASYEHLLQVIQTRLGHLGVTTMRDSLSAMLA